MNCVKSINAKEIYLKGKTFVCIFILMLSFVCCGSVDSLGIPKVASIPFIAVNDSKAMTVTSSEARSGRIQLTKPKDLQFTFDIPVRIPLNYSLEIAYSFSIPDTHKTGDLERYLEEWEENNDLHFISGDNQDAWTLPVTLSVMGFPAREEEPEIIYYSVPLTGSNLESFLIKTVKTGQRDTSGKVTLEIHSFKLVPRWFGYVEDEKDVRITPFVYLEEKNGADIITINPLEKYWFPSPELSVYGFQGMSAANSRENVNSIRLGIINHPVEPEKTDIYIDIAGSKIDPYPLSVSGQAVPFAVLQSSENRAFSLKPIVICPMDIPSYSKNDWRGKKHEIFRWDRFPLILFLDTADYRTQDKYLKRIAFFVEKDEFSGVISTDEEIAHLNGWNAHDYRAKDLARFYETARLMEFPLNEEEMELRQILFDQDIIRHTNLMEIVPGEGAIISISQESESYLRYRFTVHEGFHGLFFIDKEFEAFSRSRWDNLAPVAKRFITEFFDLERYDTKSKYLMANELMAYCLQQPVNLAGDYFGRNVAGRLYASPARRHVLPPRSSKSNSWPLLAEYFTKEAVAFSDYVEARWGLTAGSLR